MKINGKKDVIMKIIKTAIFAIVCLVAIALPIVLVESSPAVETSAAEDVYT